MSNRKLNLQNFRQWLESNKSKVVGIVFDHCHCPIAQYIQQTHNIRTSVDGNVIRYLDNANVETMELWSSRFVRWLDSEYSHSVYVLGSQALKVLDDSEAYWTTEEDNNV